MVINKRVVIAASIIAMLLVIYGILGLNGLNYQKTITGQATAILTVIAPAEIPTQDLSFLFMTATPTTDPAFGDLKEVSVDSYVQIIGTSGAGLKIRQNPGTGSDTNFIASDSEVFQVIGGPILQDNIVWWNVVTPYDNARQGWAAADYLTIIENK